MKGWLPSFADRFREHNLGRKDVATIWGCSERAVTDKLQDENVIRLDEIRAADAKCDFSIGECYEIVKGKPFTYKALQDCRL